MPNHCVTLITRELHSYFFSDPLTSGSDKAHLEGYTRFFISSYSSSTYRLPLRKLNNINPTLACLSALEFTEANFAFQFASQRISNRLVELSSQKVTLTAVLYRATGISLPGFN